MYCEVYGSRLQRRLCNIMKHGYLFCCSTFAALILVDIQRLILFESVDCIYFVNGLTRILEVAEVLRLWLLCAYLFSGRYLSLFGGVW